jgi:2-polyprenyl-3-methyl-5-hydroxy-6-metoxy-1,4-benzoquinol methylase
MRDISSPQDTCLACGSARLVDLIDLGVQPHANDFSDTLQLKFRESLRLRGCRDCGHAQQAVFVRPEILFADYHYASGTSRSLKQYFDHYAAELAARLGPDTRILEVACNDGSFLDSLAAAGFKALRGVDPAGNIVATARAKGLDVDVDFFNQAYAAAHPQRHDLIVGQNVLAHTPDPLDLLRAAAAVLADDGEIHIQTSQANMLFNGEFDTIYHEHYSFFGAHSMRTLAQRAGLVLVSLSYPDVHGTSFRFVLKKSGSADAAVTERLAYEQQHGLLDGRCFAAFSALAQDRVSRFRQHLIEWHGQGRAVVGVGVAAKSVTFFNYAGVFPDHVVDEAPLKIGKYLPGSPVRVAPLTGVGDYPQGTVFVVGAWNFFNELKAKIAAVRGDQGRADLFVRYLPALEMQPC